MAYFLLEFYKVGIQFRQTNIMKKKNDLKHDFFTVRFAKQYSRKNSASSLGGGGWVKINKSH